MEESYVRSFTASTMLADKTVLHSKVTGGDDWDVNGLENQSHHETDEKSDRNKHNSGSKNRICRFEQDIS